MPRVFIVFVGNEFTLGRGQSDAIQITLLDSLPMGGAYLPMS
ncbi:hypothetical protein [Alicyclobacillus sendaiensis]